MGRFSAAAFGLVGLVALGLPSLGLAQVAPSADLQGAYAPGGDCARTPRVVIGADALTIHAPGGAVTRLGPLDSCRTCPAGDRPDVIEVWVAPLDRNRNPIEPMFRVNADEKRGALVVDRQGMQAFPPAVRAVAMASPLKRCSK